MRATEDLLEGMVNCWLKTSCSVQTWLYCCVLLQVCTEPQCDALQAMHWSARSPDLNSPVERTCCALKAP